ncbi:MAG: hypothetical protein GVY19_11945 [Bacteroidetes bacterium]|jgi:hypothetical protein|nr:hypothetical protein [Bacteroidota bacterium]
MKKIIIPVITSLFILSATAQEFDKQIAEAQNSYNNGDLENTRFAIQNALREIDVQIGKDVLALLPEQINGLSSDPAHDEVTSVSSGFIGLFIERNWSDMEKNISFSVISDSPMLAGVNALLAMPLMVTSSDNNQKKIKVNGYKALLQRSVDDQNKVTEYALQLPFSNALMNITYDGEISELEFMAIIDQIPVGEVINIAK